MRNQSVTQKLNSNAPVGFASTMNLHAMVSPSARVVMTRRPATARLANVSMVISNVAPASASKLIRNAMVWMIAGTILMKLTAVVKSSTFCYLNYFI